MLIRTSVPVALVLLIGFAFVSNRSEAATADECRRINPSYIPAPATAPAVLNGTIRAGDCYNPNDNAIGQQAEAAKRYLLETRNACSGGQGITGENPNNCILKLNDDFAIKLEKLFKENPENLFTDIKILSGYRTEQGELRVSGKTGGNHRLGCAVDLTGTNSSNRTCLRVCQFIKAQSSRLGLRVPYDYSPEYNHVEPTAACNGNAPGAPNTPGSGRVMPPTSGLADTFRTSLYGPQTQQPPYQPPMMQPPPSPLTSGSGITNAFGQPTPSLAPVASAPVQTQTQTQGTSGSLITSSSTNTNVNTNTNTNTNVNSNTAISDQLQELAFGSGSVATSSSLATSVPVVITGATAGTIAYVDGQEPPSQQSTTSVGSLPVGQQTFTSETAALHEASIYMSPVQLTLYQTLNTLKSALTILLEYLKPFGRPYMENGY